ncbi:hypothetical protein DXG01_005511, partial [Tephrocybe rancida]
ENHKIIVFHRLKTNLVILSLEDHLPVTNIHLTRHFERSLAVDMIGGNLRGAIKGGAVEEYLTDNDIDVRNLEYSDDIMKKWTGDDAIGRCMRDWFTPLKLQA